MFKIFPALLTGLVDLRLLPWKESVRLRRARQSPPVPAELLASAPEPSEELLEGWREAEVIATIDLPVERLVYRVWPARFRDLPGRRGQLRS